MLSVIAALTMSACTTLMVPAAEMYRAQLGKPDAYRTSMCGGGEDEYGKPLKKWKCLVWTYEGKGTIWFEQLSGLPENYFVVTGCYTGTPRITAGSGPVWVLNSCDDKNRKEKPCNTIGFGLDETDDFKGKPKHDEFGNSQPAALRVWSVNQPQYCPTMAEAKKALAACVLPPPEPKPEPQEPATQEGVLEKAPVVPAEKTSI